MGTPEMQENTLYASYTPKTRIVWMLDIANGALRIEMRSRPNWFNRLFQRLIFGFK